VTASHENNARKQRTESPKSREPSIFELMTSITGRALPRSEIVNSNGILTRVGGELAGLLLCSSVFIP
jgi:hypothetical protein